MYGFYDVYFTQDIRKELTHRGATEGELTELANAIANYPRQKGLDVDTSDNMVTFAGYPISFLRDHKTQKIWIMTNGEALNCDVQTGHAKVKYAKELIIALENIGASDKTIDELEPID